MFFFLNKKNILQIILLVALMIWSIYSIVTQMVICDMSGQSMISQNIFFYLSEHPFLLKFLAVVLLMLTVFFIQRYYEENKFADFNTLLPSVIFLLLVNMGHFLQTFTPAFATLAITTFIMLFGTFHGKDKVSLNLILSTGVIIGIATLLDPNAIWYLLFFLMVLLFNQFVKAKDLLILLVGFLTVVIYLFSIAYLTDTIPSVLHSIKYLQTFELLKNFKTISVLEMVTLGVLLFLSLYAAVTGKLYYDNKLIILRKRFRDTHFLFFVSIIILFFSGLTKQESLLYMMLPLTLYISSLCLIKNRKLFHDLLIITLCVLLWF